MDKPQYPYRILLLGVDGVGRTTMTLQFALGRVTEEYDPIIHDTFKKRIEFKDDIAHVEVTDTGMCPHGPGCYHISDIEIRAHEGFILIYSITDHLSFDRMRPTFERIKHVKEGESKTFFVTLVANKNDLEVHRQVSVEEGKLLAQEFGCQFFQICAKNPVDVERMFTALVQMMRQRWLRNETVTSPSKSRIKKTAFSHGTCTMS